MRFANGVATYEIDSLPGCSQVAVSHAMFIAPEFRGQHRSYEEGARRIQQLEALEYDYALATVDLTNRAQIKQLIKNGWTCLNVFNSSRTGNAIGIYGRHLGNDYSNRIDGGMANEFKNS